MPAKSPYIIDPIWKQFAALLPEREVDHPLGCHRPRIPQRGVFDKLVQLLVFGCAYERIADEECSATTLRRRRDEWIASGVMEQLQEIVLDAYDRMIGLDLSDVAVDGCITKHHQSSLWRREGGQKSRGSGQTGIKRSVVVVANGIPLRAIAAPASRHDSPLLEQTLGTLEAVGKPPERMSVHLERDYDSKTTREKLELRGLLAEIPQKGKPAPVASTKRWVVERTDSWNNAHKKLVWCTEREDQIIDFWLAFSGVIITVGRLIRHGWTHYRWEG
jgi:transposase